VGDSDDSTDDDDNSSTVSVKNRDISLPPVATLDEATTVLGGSTKQVKKEDCTATSNPTASASQKRRNNMFTTIDAITDKQSGMLVQVTQMKLDQKAASEKAECQARAKEAEDARRHEREEKRRQHEEKMMVMQLELARINCGVDLTQAGFGGGGFQFNLDGIGSDVSLNTSSDNNDIFYLYCTGTGSY
jgi:hypothetical protein